VRAKYSAQSSGRELIEEVDLDQNELTRDLR
jgi:hypothetical protein